MWKPHAGLQFVGVLVVFAVLAIASSAVADTIYLKNGRVIHTSSHRVEGDYVIFTQFRGEARIPMSEVERIEEDDIVEPEPMAVRPPSSSESGGDPGESGDAGESGSAEAPADPNAPAPENDPRRTRDYWQQRLSAIASERELLNERLDVLQLT